MGAAGACALTWPPENMTGVEAGFGRYGMVAPFGGDCGNNGAERLEHSNGNDKRAS